VTSPRWCVWLGQEVEGVRGAPGELRLFVHELSFTHFTKQQRSDWLTQVARTYHVGAIYFCAEHVKAHGMEFVRQVPHDIPVVVCFWWPDHVGLIRHRVHPPQRNVMELAHMADDEVDEVKLVVGDFTVRCIATKDMPCSNPRDYSRDVVLLENHDVGQQRG